MPLKLVVINDGRRGRQGVTDREVRYVADEQVKYWQGQGITADEAIQAVTGAKFVCGYSWTQAHGVISDAWRHLQ